MPWASIAAAALTTIVSVAPWVAVLIWRLSALTTRVEYLQEQIKELNAYSHNNLHELRSSIHNDLGSLEKMILRITQQDLWPKD